VDGNNLAQKGGEEYPKFAKKDGDRVLPLPSGEGREKLLRKREKYK